MNKIEYYMTLARAVSVASQCHRKKVGAVLVDGEGRIVSTGYNGTPAKSTKQAEIDNETQPYVIHAEINAILFAKRDLKGCRLFVTTSPCLHCAAMIVQSGITEVFFEELYRDSRGVDFLIEHNINCKKI